MTDQHARNTALDITRSFLVQAPAGSGKTELLSQRFLKLLAHVHSPEEVIAITFTRKAAAEMRERILIALTHAHDNRIPSEAHMRVTFNLATQALAQDAAHNWHLLANPNRLRILTIDALAGFLSAQIPILSGFGSKPEISDDVSVLYEEAARELISSLTEETPWCASLQTLLLHLDNQATRAVDLLCAILAKREQWLPHILAYHGNDDLLHQHLNTSLAHIVDDTLHQAHDAFGNSLQELTDLLKHAATTLIEFGNDTHPLTEIHRIDTLRGDVSQRTIWVTIAEYLLTQKDEIRKSIDKRQGFLPNTDEKARMCELLACFKEHPVITSALINVKYCPPLSYPQSQRDMIDALIQLLPILYAQLRLTFQKHNRIDFVELNLAAQRALGEDAEPTDLALYLDHQIRHLLIDEFQDTSITQYQLLEGLTRGWEPDDGRSLFLVGDPMQSIYRFRDAEVGLFIRAQTQPINHLSLTTLVLTNNYRSDTTVVDWINTHFANIFPSHANITHGAVPYTPSTATRNFTNSHITVRALIDQTAAEEAHTIIHDIQTIRQHHPDDSIAILVRSRNQLSAILPLLQDNNLTYSAVDLETLIHRCEIHDLLTLLRVVTHRHDRIAWLALLRSPICGLTLCDLHTVSQHSCILDGLDDDSISTDGKQRIAPIARWLDYYFVAEHRLPFELALKGLWQALGFPTLLSPQAQENCACFFDLLTSLLNDGQLCDVDSLYRSLEKTYVKPKDERGQLSIMTIHKSKGLEFDHVLLPGLNQKSGSDRHDLMLWTERPNLNGDIDFILAPIKQATHDNDAIYRYLQRLEKAKLDYETARLLYVATTRARKSLYLYACIPTSKGDQLQFNNGSFAALLAHEFKQEPHPVINTSETPDPTRTTLTRINASWSSPYCYPAPQQPVDNPLPESDNTIKRLIGTLIHEALADPRYFMPELATRRLKQVGIVGQHLTQALALFQQVKQHIDTDPRAQWIFDTAHTDAHNEFPITTVLSGKVRHLIIDRTFIDRDGIRWIIDYKTATPDTDNHQMFLEEQLALYQTQLTTYARAFHALDGREVRTGLYFPTCKLWISGSLIPS